MVTGIVYVKDIGFGVKGMVHGVDTFYGIAEDTYGRPESIARGLEVLSCR